MSNATLTVDLDAVVKNWRALDLLGGSESRTGAVVKADAYGLGLEPVADALHRAGAQNFFVATACEGQALRKVVGTGPVIYIFCGHMPTDTAILHDAALTPLINDPAQFQRHIDQLPNMPFGVQIDTGMSRLGFQTEDWRAFRGDILRRKPVLLMSHLACADEPDHPMNQQQLAAFHAATDDTGCRRSLAATGGVLLGPAYHFDLTRPGIGLFGGLPYADANAVVELSVPVIQIRVVPAGTGVGYAATWTAPGTTRIATIAAGYADGLLRTLSNTAFVMHQGIACPVIGRVSMDMITVDISHLPDDPQSLTVIGAAQSPDDLAAAAGTIGYEILTSLGARYERRYKPAP